VASQVDTDESGVSVQDHIDDVSNPHSVDKTDVGLGNVQNIDTTDANNIDTDDSGVNVQEALDALETDQHTHSNKAQLDLVTDGDHDVRTDNPHSVTKTQVGLSNVENVDTTDANNIDTDDSGVNVQEALDAVEADVSTNTSDITNLKKSSVSFVIDGGGSEITTGVKGDLLVPFGGTITKCTLLADQSGSIVVDIWKDTYTNYPATDADSIIGSGGTEPTISTATKSQDSTLTGWTTSISEDDILRFNVDSVTTIERVTVILEITRT
jgi:hypothetical protein